MQLSFGEIGLLLMSFCFTKINTTLVITQKPTKWLHGAHNL